MRRRRWLQFSLRTFLVVISLAAVGMGIWVHRVRNQQRAVEALTALGARIVYEHQWPAWAGLPGAAPFNQAEPPGPAWLRRWLGDAYFVKVVSVYFFECPKRLTSEELVHLDLLPSSGRSVSAASSQLPRLALLMSRGTPRWSVCI